jgi:hypothetical protein
MSDALVSTMTRPMLRAAAACPAPAASANRETLSLGTRPDDLEIVRSPAAADVAVVCLALDAALPVHSNDSRRNRVATPINLQSGSDHAQTHAGI